jgi:putative endonuclease
MSYFIYILKSLKDGRYYIGSSDVKNRLDYHNQGRQRSTKHRTPFVLIYTEEHPSRTVALAREKQIKNYKGGEAFKRLINS